MRQLSMDIILQLVRRFWKWCVLFGALGAVAMALYTHYLIPNRYTSFATLFVQNGTISTETISTGNLSAAQDMVTSAKTLLSSDFAVSKAVSVLGDESLKGALRGSLSFTTNENNDSITVYATTTDPLTSARFCEAMVAVAPEVMADVFSVAKVQVLEKPNIPVSPSSPNLVKNCITGGILGVIAVIGVAVLRALLDNRVGNEEDFRQRSDLVVLGEIPTFSSVQRGGVNHG